MDRANVIQKIQNDIKKSNEQYLKRIIQHLQDLYQSGKLSKLVNIDESDVLGDNSLNTIYVSSQHGIVGTLKEVFEALMQKHMTGSLRVDLINVDVQLIKPVTLSPNTIFISPLFNVISRNVENVVKILKAIQLYIEKDIKRPGVLDHYIDLRTKLPRQSEKYSYKDIAKHILYNNLQILQKNRVTFDPAVRFNDVENFDRRPGMSDDDAMKRNKEKATEADRNIPESDDPATLQHTKTNRKCSTQAEAIRKAYLLKKLEEPVDRIEQERHVRQYCRDYQSDTYCPSIEGLNNTDANIPIVTFPSPSYTDSRRISDEDDLRNYKNSNSNCYLHSIFQFLKSIPEFMELLQEVKRSPVLSLGKTLSELITHDNNKTSEFLGRLLSTEGSNKNQPVFKAGQQDAQEFLNIILNSEQVLWGQEWNTSIRNIFKSISWITYRVNVENFDDYSVKSQTGLTWFQTFDNDVSSVLDFGGFFNTTPFEFNNKWFCDYSKFFQVPKYFTIPLKRFTWGPSSGQKSRQSVNICERILPNAQYRSLFPEPEKITIELLAVVCHIGDTMSSGHYVTYRKLKNHDVFSLFDDTSNEAAKYHEPPTENNYMYNGHSYDSDPVKSMLKVGELQEDPFVSRNAYIALYKVSLSAVQPSSSSSSSIPGNSDSIGDEDDGNSDNGNSASDDVGHDNDGDHAAATPESVDERDLQDARSQPTLYQL